MFKIEGVPCLPSFWKNIEGGFPPCQFNNIKEFRDLQTKLAKIQEKFIGNSEKHGCPPDCHEIHYNPTLHYFEDSVNSETYAHFLLQPYFSSFYVEKKEEYFIYDFNAMISDLGGNLGLFLGYSLLSLLLMFNQ